MPEIIGVQFQTAGKIYYFDSCGQQIETDDHVIVETARGVEYARVSLATHWLPEEDIKEPLKPIIRVADDEDRAVYEENLEAAKEAYSICQEKIAYCGLDMKLVNVEYTFDRAKVIFNFTADERVDFRELIKELAAVFHTRIELRQIGVRDEAKIIGGIGICGEPLCCHRFLTDFSPVSIKMAKEQNLSLNPTKISGCCGRLLCCLNYENEHYVEANRCAKEAARAAKEAAAEKEKEAALAASLDAAAYPDEKEETLVEDDHTEVTVETYYDPSLVKSTVDAIKHDNNRSRRSSDKHHDKQNNGRSSDKSSQKHKKTNKRPADHHDDAMPKEEKMRKPRKRGSRGGRNRNKSNGNNKSNSSK